MIRKVLLILFGLFFLNISFGLSGENCTGNNYYIEGKDIVKIGQELKYAVSNYNDVMTWELIKDNKVVYTAKKPDFVYKFKTTGPVVLSVSFFDGKCDISIKKEIKVYKQIILSIKNNNVNFVPTKLLNEKGIYFKNIKLKDLDNYNYMLKNADYVIIDQDNIIGFFSKFSNENLDNKKFILLISSFKGFYSKFIIPYIKNISRNNIYVYDNNDFLNILESIYKGEGLDKSKLFISSSVGDKIYFPLSYFVNKLIASGISINDIGIVFLALFGIIVIAIFRQVIGFSVFGVYTPLLFVILIEIIGIKIALLLFLLSIISNIITYLITKKIYILYSSKIALNYIIYVICSIIFFGLSIKYNLISNSIINNTIILAFFIMPLLSKNLIKEETNIFSKSFWLFLFEFMIITAILLFIFSFNTLKYILIAYPDLLWLFVIFTILIGRFSGLQVLEYIRFYPLIKKGIYEEE